MPLQVTTLNTPKKAPKMAQVTTAKTLKKAPEVIQVNNLNTLKLASGITAQASMHMSRADMKSLSDVHELLNRLYVRNRNQHRRSHWFTSLSVLRKQLGLLLEELAGEDPKKATQMVEARLKFWDAHGIHQWYLTFTQLVAAGQFAVIGLVLMAATARVCKVVGITDFYEELGSTDMKMVLKTIDKGTAAAVFGELSADEGEGEGEDEGIVMSRK